MEADGELLGIPGSLDSKHVLDVSRGVVTSLNGLSYPKIDNYDLQFLL